MGGKEREVLARGQWWGVKNEVYSLSSSDRATSLSSWEGGGRRGTRSGQEEE